MPSVFVTQMGASMDDLEIQRAVMERLTVPKYWAGRALGWGRRATDAAVAGGKMPILDSGLKETVPTAWLRKQLQIEEKAPGGGRRPEHNK
jgi:hypothetical protein